MFFFWEVKRFADSKKPITPVYICVTPELSGGPFITTTATALDMAEHCSNIDAANVGVYLNELRSGQQMLSFKITAGRLECVVSRDDKVYDIVVKERKIAAASAPIEQAPPCQGHYAAPVQIPTDDDQEKYGWEKGGMVTEGTPPPMRFDIDADDALDCDRAYTGFGVEDPACGLWDAGCCRHSPDLQQFPIVQWFD